MDFLNCVPDHIWGRLTSGQDLLAQTSPDDGSNWLALGLTVFGLLSVYLIGMPLLILSTLKLEKRPRIIPFDSSEKKPPRDVIKFYENADRQLTELGFEQITGVLLPTPAPNVRMILWLYVHHANRDAAMISCLWGMDGSGHATNTRYVEILSEYQDGNWVQILTNNNDEVSAFPDPPTHLISRMPHVDNVEQLYRYHQRIVRREGQEGRKMLTLMDGFGGDVERYLQQKVFIQEFERQVENGYLKVGSSGHFYNPTLTGAFPMTWKQLFPIKQMIQANYKRRGRKLEEELRATG